MLSTEETKEEWSGLFICQCLQATKILLRLEAKEQSNLWREKTNSQRLIYKLYRRGKTTSS